MFTFSSSDVTVTSQQQAAAAAAAAAATAMLASYTWRLPGIDSSVASSPYARVPVGHSYKLCTAIRHVRRRIEKLT